MNPSPLAQSLSEGGEQLFGHVIPSMEAEVAETTAEL
jgi:hypothetical protein